MNISFLKLLKPKKIQVTVAIHKRKEVDCSIRNEIHQKLIKELEQDKSGTRDGR